MSEKVNKLAQSKQMNEQCEQMDERVAHYLRQEFWLFWTIVQLLLGKHIRAIYAAS